MARAVARNVARATVFEFRAGALGCRITPRGESTWVPEQLMEVVLRVTWGPPRGQPQMFGGPGLSGVGRSLPVPFSLPDDRLMSREHFQIELTPPLLDLIDLGSTNGTKVNGLR